MCDDYFDTVDATVVCQELGLPSSNARVGEHVQFGAGEGQIWMDDVACTGSENRLNECEHRGWGDHNCGHNEDVAVICEGIKLIVPSGAIVKPLYTCEVIVNQVFS